MANEQEMPDVVYHYTSMHTLLKIVDSSAIWATNVRYLNDISEYQHFLSLINDLLMKELPSRPSATGMQEKEGLSNYLRDVERESFDFFPYVASFSLDGDSLTQWRSYCPQGNGVCIGFRTEALRITNAVPDANESPQRRQQPKLEPVLYLRSDDKEAIERLFEELKSEAREMGERDPRELYDQYGVRLLVRGVSYDYALWLTIRRQSSRIKHASFSSEREYRLVVTTSGLDPAIRYRSSRSTLVPYIPLRIPNPKEYLAEKKSRSPGFKPHFIDSVTIGPTPNLDLSADALRDFFMQRNFDVDIHKSIVPFRDL